MKDSEGGDNLLDSRTRELLEANARLQREIAERQVINESLRRTEGELRSLLDNSPDMILKTGPDLRIIWANRTAMEMNPGCVGMFCYRAFPGRDEICEGCPVASAIETKHIQRGVMYQPVSDTTSDEQYWENIGVPQFDESGEVIACVEISRNITDRMQITMRLEAANRMLKEAKEAAESANLSKTVFLANMSHELRTPLNAVLGFSQLMKNAPDATAEQRKNLEIITRSGEHLLNLINNILDISKIESGHVLLEETSTALHQLVEELRSLMYVRATEKGLSFTVEQSPDLPRNATVDAGKLRQVLINLIGNAIKYTETGGVILHAGVAQWEPPQFARLRFEVKDSGRGIRVEDMERIFHPFEQLANQPVSEAGTGLGLTICKQYVELMGGQLGVTSEPGAGSVFHFEIPVAVLPAEETLAEPHRGRAIGLEEGQPRYRLLIAEDQPDNRLLLYKLLEPLGFDLREATNGQEALEIFEQWHPDLIWMDVRMPVMDGSEATRRIKLTEAGARTKIIALTAHALEEERREILASGCDDFVRKPYRDSEIFDALANHLGIRFQYAVESPATAETKTSELNVEQLRKLPRDITDRLSKAVELLDG
ncbi:MAG: ATP-binding protein, partial [FCB group bacterium]|nr:ATP-binding protein [FCB group bacterium]